MVDTYQVITTPPANRSLEDIVDYLRRTASDETALYVRNGILETIKKLRTMPDANGIQHNISTEEITYRRIIKWSYRIIFTIDEGEATVYVLLIDHTKRDPERLKRIFGVE